MIKAKMNKLEAQILLTKQVSALLKMFEKSQYEFKVDYNHIKDKPIVTRDDLRKIEIPKDAITSSTSGSTGEPVTVIKTKLDSIWYLATNVRACRWRGWDFSKDLAIIKPGIKTEDSPSWGVPNTIEPIQGRCYKTGVRPIRELQQWLEEKNPHYLSCLPSVRDSLDLTKISNLISWSGTGEMGGTAYSSEECGTIALQCPDNSEFYHVMENQIVEEDKDGSAIITTLTNPYIRRYKHGDHIKLGKCTCSRSLQAIQKIYGRVRNMFIMRNGDKKWPLFGSRSFYERYNIKKFQIVQKSVELVIAKIVSDTTVDEIRLIKDIHEWLDPEVKVIVEYVNGFEDYKFEEFKNEMEC